MSDVQAKNFNPTENRSYCDINLASVPVKSVRIIVHIFQKDDGSGNIPENTDGDNFQYYIWSDASNKLQSLQPMTSPTSSPYIADSKLKIQSVGTYWWKNTTMWAKGDNTSANGNALYNFVMQQNIPGKSEAIHVFMPGNYLGDGLSLGGIASGIGDKKWALIEDVYSTYLNGNFWEQSAVLRHEIGHNMGLYHTFQSPPPGDYCDDTPVSSRQWGYDNNLIAYNPFTNAMTIDKITRCHRSLQDDAYILFSGSNPSVLRGTVDSPNNQYDGPLGSVSQIGASSANIFLSSNSPAPINWTKTSGAGMFNSNNSGKYVNINNLGSISLQAKWTDNCIDFSATYGFYRGYYYSAGPNPSVNYVNIAEEGDDEGFESTSKSTGGISKIELYDRNNNLVKTQSYSAVKSTQVDISGLPSGMVYLMIYGGAKEPVTIKIMKQ